MKISATLSLFLFIISASPAEDYRPMPGDLLFQDLDCGASCDAIEAVTQGINGAKLSHVGMLIIKDHELLILEAITKGVVLTPLDSFLNRSSDSAGFPKVIVGRLKPKYGALIPEIVASTSAYVGKPYNHTFDFNEEDKYYCSEMLYEIFKTANDGKDIFTLSPMTFKIPGSNEFFPQWITYFDELNAEIPEGEPGLNPGSMSRSSAIEIVYVYGQPEGWTKKDLTK